MTLGGMEHGERSMECGATGRWGEKAIPNPFVSRRMLRRSLIWVEKGRYLFSGATAHLIENLLMHASRENEGAMGRKGD